VVQVGLIFGDDWGMPISQPSSAAPLRVALVGYGSAARVFHAPLISGVPGLALACIVSGRPQAVHQDWPQMKVWPTLQDACAQDAMDLVVIATPNDSHYPLALTALQAGKHVLVDKPCAVTLAQTEHLLAEAAQRQRVFSVFQNRRFDADFLALQQVLADGALGRVVEVVSHFDRYRPSVPERWRERDLPGSGLWYDLGPHLLDQALVLFGLPDALWLDWAALRDGAQVNDWFHAVLRYDTPHGGLRVLLHAGTLVAATGPRWTVHGTRGSFTHWGLDAQEDALKAGARPQAGQVDWPPASQTGEVLTLTPMPGVAAPVSVRRPAPQPAGSYLDFYVQWRDHLLGHAPLTVTPQQAHAVMRMLHAGVTSVAEQRWVPLVSSAAQSPQAQP